ncbi:MAG: serine hydrolase [Williamsia sp.]|nr:serine hydrolase [Williamsia sp.]
MPTSRRNFIKTTGFGAAGMAFLPFLPGIGDIGNGRLAASLPYASPESKGVSSKGIRNFLQAAAASGIGWHSFVLVRHGHIVAEGWWKPFEPQFKHTLYSLSKSFTSTAIGLLVKDGKLRIDQPVISFFPDELPASPGENLKKMKVRSLLTMNTGHGEDTMPKMRDAAKPWTTTFLEQPVQYEPGSHFLYNTGATYMLGAIVHKITGQTLEKFLSPRLFQPLDITEHDWETSPQGLNTAGYGLRIKTGDIAKFGQLYLQKGQWNGKEILSPAWVNEATSYQTSSQEGNGDWAQGYGYQFWRCKPAGLYRGDGAYGQYCIVMPEQDAVLAITSESWDMQKSMTTAWENLLPAMQAGSLPENGTEWNELKKELKTLVLAVPKGAATSTASGRYNNKKFRLDQNEFGATEIRFAFSPDGCTWTIRTAQGETAIRFGWSNWLLNGETMKYPFPVSGRIHMPSKIGGAAAWQNEQTLQLNARFVEAMHGDKITCKFDGDKITLSFLNSVSENTKTSPEKRADLTGVLV